MIKPACILSHTTRADVAYTSTHSSHLAECAPLKLEYARGAGAGLLSARCQWDTAFTSLRCPQVELSDLHEHGSNSGGSGGLPEAIDWRGPMWWCMTARFSPCATSGHMSSLRACCLPTAMCHGSENYPQQRASQQHDGRTWVRASCSAAAGALHATAARRGDAGTIICTRAVTLGVRVPAIGAVSLTS